MTKNRPETIDKREFTCNRCGYTAQVYGESYFDSGCHNFMATFECSECKVMFEGLISQINLDEDTFEAEHGLVDEIQCLRCGKHSSKVWNKKSGKCPKCQNEMIYVTDGVIRVKY